jgi:PAS domain S-box-containing protein
MPETPKTNRSILVINAYHSGYEWSDRETKGIVDTLQELKQPPVVYLEYLDTKRQPEELHLLRMKEHIEKIYSHLKLDLIIAQDNWGLEFVERYRDELFPNIPILFCGINGKTPEDFKYRKNSTGILERHDMANTIKMALFNHPQTKYIYLLNDSSISSQNEHKRFLKEEALSNVEVRYISDFSWDKISEKITQLPENSILILSTSIVDKYYRVLSGKDIGRIISRYSNVPVYTTIDIFMDEGVIGGRIISAYEHGHQTGLLAKKILEGTSPDSIPVTYDNSLKWFFNYNSLVNWNIYPKNLPEGSVIAGKPQSYAKLLWWIIPGLLFILLQFALIMFLLIARSRWKNALKEIKRRERHLHLLIEHTPMPVTVLNTHLDYEYVNQIFTDTFGYSESDLLNFHLSIRRMAASEEETTRASLLMKSFLQNNRSEKAFLFKAVTKENKQIYAETYYTRVGNKIIIAYHDITARILIEENLKKARDAERSANKAKSQFLANMSHEIRTPMNAVLGMAQLLNQTQLDYEQKDYIETILNSGELLLSIINDLLDLSKIEAGHFEIALQPLDFKACVLQCTRLMEGNFRSKKLEFSSHISENCPQVVHGDHNRIQQILLNLLNNACKYTEKGSVELDVDASLIDEGTANIVIHVKDTGIGINEESLKYIFNPFNQGDSSNTRKYGGTGLGLTIVKRIVNIMGGRIDVNSKESVGSIFTVTIPMKLGKPEELNLTAKKKKSRSPHMHDLERRSILLTEDNEVNLKLTHIILKKLGLKADTAHNGNEAIEMLKQQNYDIVLMDIQMPVMDGTTATQIIRNEFPPEKQPYIIAMTAHAMASDAERFLRTGMNDYISKPVKINLLKDALYKACESVQAK